MENAQPDPSRTPPAAVRRQLRQEVGFACPVAGCGNIFLEYHHFDPPWSEQKHHEPAGMIALCTRCHPAADGGFWSKGQLAAMKKPAPHEGQGRMRWGCKELAVSIGGNWFVGPLSIITFKGKSILGVDIDEWGNLALSCDLSVDGRCVLQIEKNDVLVHHPSIHDIQANIAQSQLMVSIGRGRIVFDGRLLRLTVAELAAEASNHLAVVPHPLTGTSQVEELVQRLRHAVDDEGRIPVLSIDRLCSRLEGFEIEASRGQLRAGGFLMCGGLTIGRSGRGTLLTVS